MSYSRSSAALFVTTFVLFTSPVVFAQSDIRSEQIQFQQGAISAVIEGSITGYESVDYVLNARAGQSINISMATNNTANYFNILEPGETEVAIFNGSIDENQYEGVLRESGDYKIRVYMMRSAARRDEVADYRLEVSITGGDEVATSGSTNNGDALVEGTNFNATGDIPCSMSLEQPTGSCPFGVIREGNGTGTVAVTIPDGRTRAIFFENGTATGYDRSEADPGEFSAEKQGDLNIIRIGQERYEIPDAVIFGG